MPENESIPTINTAAERLAEAHYRVEPGISKIYALSSAEAGDRTIRLLEVNANTFESGIVPIGFGPHPRSGVPFASVIIEVTPREFEDLRNGRLQLPEGLRLVNDPYPRPTLHEVGIES